MYEKRGNSGENLLNLNGSSRWTFSGKKGKGVTFFSRFYRNDRNFLYHLSGNFHLNFRRNGKRS